MKLTKGRLAILTILIVLLIDQASKIWIKTHMSLYESFEVTSWFRICFVENNGMAFGIELFSKVFLTLFRIVAVGLIGYYLHVISKSPNYKMGYVITVALVFAGAVGNIIDSVFYGVIFNESVGEVATLFPAEGGYAPYFYGKVVDMLYFPLFNFYWPDWMPWVGGENFQFFRPVFNIADSAISVGVVIVLLFYRHYLATDEESTKKSA